MSNDKRVRPPAVAGSFYPGHEAELRAMVNALLAGVPAEIGTSGVPKALIVPHAGYVYSGSTAAAGYACLGPAIGTIRHVVIVGPCHYVGIRGIALPDADVMRTPLGDVPIWAAGADIALAQRGVEVSAAVHEREHSLEVQLPFIQRVLPGVDVLPLAAGWASPDAVAAVLEAVWGGPETLIVVSSDLSHYHPYAQAREIDQLTIAQIVGLDNPLDHEQACGATGINGLLVVARARHLRPRLVHACNSGDTAGDRRRVVGYASIAFDKTGGAHVVR